MNNTDITLIYIIIKIQVYIFLYVLLSYVALEFKAHLT